MLWIRVALAGFLLFAGEAAAMAESPTPEPGAAAPVTNAAAQPGDSPVVVPGKVLPVVMAIRIGERPDRTRLVMEVSDLFAMRLFSLANPDRIVIDMPEVLWNFGQTALPSGRGVIKGYRYGRFRPGDSRLVIDLSGPATASAPMVLTPGEGHAYRVIVDLLPVSAEKFAEQAGWPADLVNADASVPEAAAPGPPASDAKIVQSDSVRQRVIVIDAGHGGIDSGTVGVDGLMEKDLVLDEAARLAAVLKSRGYAVHLTRDSDAYIPLGERVNIARGFDADLFISLHADSNPDAGVSGASVYTLSEKGSDSEAAALARKENQSDVIAGVDLAGETSPVASILIGLAQRDTINRSDRFAETAVSSLTKTTDVLPREPHRSAAFVVLKAPDVPAVLIELGYLSNPHDCAQARTSGWRDGVASAIADAVDRQFDGAGRPEASAALKAAE